MRAQVFRTCLWLRLLVLGACGFWAAVALFVLGARAGAPVCLAALAFVALFGASAAAYERTAVEVTPDGFVFETLFRRVPVRAEEILRVRVVRGLGGTLYAVITRRGRFRFTSLLARHRELLDLVLQRARAARVR